MTTSGITDLASAKAPASLRASRKRPKRGLIAIIVLSGIVVCGGATLIYVRGTRPAPVNEVETCLVKRGPLDITVSEGGALQAERMERIRSLVHNSVNIISIVAEGTTITDEDVKSGKVLVTLDSAKLKDQATKQEIDVEGAAANLTRAREDLQIQEKQNESNIRAAELNEKFAKADLDSYLGKELAESLGGAPDFTALNKSAMLGGIALQKRTQLNNDVGVSDEQVKRALDKVGWTKKLYDKKYVTGNELQADQLSQMQQENQYKQAQLALSLFLTYEMPKEAETRYAALREKRLETERVKSKANSERAQALAQLKSAERSYNVQKQQLDDVKEQIENCQIRTDKPGLVVYASSTDSWRRNRAPIEEGAAVYERQEIIFLPDLSSLIARVRIHESAVKKIKPGQQATVTVDAYPDLVLHGTVKDVAPLPDPQGWMQDVKAFTTNISIEGNHSYLKPGISCRATITIAKLPDAVYVPLQSVTMSGDDQVCMVVTPKGQAQRKVETGDSDDKFVEIKAGLKEGERVLLNPGILTPEKEMAEAEAAKRREAEEKAAAAAAAKAEAGAPASAEAGNGGAAKSDSSQADAAKVDAAGKSGDGENRSGRGRRVTRPEAEKAAPVAAPEKTP